MNESRSMKTIEQSHDILLFIETYVKKVQVIEDQRIKVFVVTASRTAGNEKTATGGSIREAVSTLMRGEL